MEKKKSNFDNKTIYDKEAIADLADPIDVAIQIGMDVTKRGSHFFIPCPHPDHDDINATNCILTKNGYKCFACGATGDIFTMVKDFYASQGVKMFFPDAIKIVADTLGGANAFVMEGEDVESKNITTIPFTSKELKALGISVSSKELPVAAIVDEVDVDDVSKEYAFKKNNNEILMVKQEQPLINLYNENPVAFMNLIKRKIKEKKTIYRTAIENYTERDSACAPLIFDIFAQNNSLDGNILTELKNIYQKKIFEIIEIESKLNMIESKGDHF